MIRREEEKKYYEKELVTITPEEIDDSLSDNVRQYIQGNLAKAQRLKYIKDDQCEIGMSFYREDTHDEPHYHTEITETNYIISGEVVLVNTETGERRRVKKGGLFSIPPHVGHVLEIKSGTRILFVKNKSINDKIVIPIESIEKWKPQSAAPKKKQTKKAVDAGKKNKEKQSIYISRDALDYIWRGKALRLLKEKRKLYRKGIDADKYLEEQKKLLEDEFRDNTEKLSKEEKRRLKNDCAISEGKAEALLSKNADNRKKEHKNRLRNLGWVWKKFYPPASVGWAAITAVVEVILAGVDISNKVILIAVAIDIIVCLIWALDKASDLINYKHFDKVSGKSGTIEIALNSGYIENAKKYKAADMFIGLNTSFWFRTAAPKSLVSDIWDYLEADGSTPEGEKVTAQWVQSEIDKKIMGERDEYLDSMYLTDTTIHYRDENDNVCTEYNRPLFKVGTVVYVEYISKATRAPRRLYFLANADIVNNEGGEITVENTRGVPVATTFHNIWKVREETTFEEGRWTRPILVPLIGCGVANDYYTDMETFRKLVDLYFENLFATEADKHPAVKSLIINIRNDTALGTSSQGRDINMEKAVSYIKEMAEVRAVPNR